MKSSLELLCSLVRIRGGAALNCWGSGGMVDGGLVTKVNLFYNGHTGGVN